MSQTEKLKLGRKAKYLFIYLIQVEKSTNLTVIIRVYVRATCDKLTL